MSPTESTLTLILALGADTRLAPLTTDRAKSAIPFGGNYRVIDFTLANCLRSGLRRVLVFTQYRSHSLQRHLHDGWSIFNPELGEFITSIPPQMMSDSAGYAGAIDALYQNLHMVERNASDYVCVLSGEHVYRMDYAALIDFHVARKAAATIACIRPDDLIYKDFQCCVEVEGEAVAAFAAPVPGAQATSLASMEVYVFSKAAFVQAVTESRRAAPPGQVDPVIRADPAFHPPRCARSRLPLRREERTRHPGPVLAPHRDFGRLLRSEHGSPAPRAAHRPLSTRLVDPDLPRSKSARPHGARPFLRRGRVH